MLKMFKIHDFITARDGSTAVPVNEQQGALKASVRGLFNQGYFKYDF